MGEKLTEKILHQARQQKEELEEEFGVGTSRRTEKRRRKSQTRESNFRWAPQATLGPMTSIRMRLWAKMTL